MTNDGENGSPFIFVFGSGRSGTTLVREILNQHPDINILPETGFYDRLWGARRMLGAVRCRDARIRWLYYLLYQSYDPAMTVYRQYFANVTDEFEKNAPRDENEFFIRFVKTLGELKGKKIFGEKTPRHLLYWEKVLSEIPGSQAIITMRDPRAVVSSMLKRGDLASDVWKAAVEWRLYTDTIRQIIDKYGARVKLVKYEDLVLDSVKVIGEICEFIGVEFCSTMQQGGESNSSYGQKNVGIFSDSLERWRKELTTTELELVERIAGDGLVEYGYRPEAAISSTGLTMRERILYWWMMFEVMLGKVGLRPIRAYLRNFRCQ